MGILDPISIGQLQVGKIRSPKSVQHKLNLTEIIVRNLIPVLNSDHASSERYINLEQGTSLILSRLASKKSEIEWRKLTFNVYGGRK